MCFLSMTDRRTRDSELGVDDTREKRSRVYKLPQNILKPNTNSNARKHTRSPTASLCFPKDLETPKRRSRFRFNGCSNGDSPSEAETQQDIIWDPASPPPMWNGKGAGDGVRVVEISDIVNRIAPNDQRPIDRDLVLQWIGDNAIPSTPEIQHPRARKCSIRRQSHNVEDLMKLAKQFDLNMTRQDNERTLQTPQDSEERNNQCLAKLNKCTAHHPEPAIDGSSSDVHKPHSAKPKVLSHEEELHALFDGPTQHLSRLSPPSANCSQESRAATAPIHVKGPASEDVKNIHGDATQVSKSDFDDDWENDDLLNDIFVLEMTQSSDPSSSVPPRAACHTESAVSRKCKPAVDSNSPGAGSRRNSCASFQQGSIRQYTKIPSNTCGTLTTFRMGLTGLGGTVQQTPKANTQSENQAQTICSKQQAVTTLDCDKMKNETKSTGCSGAKESKSLARVSGKAAKTLDLYSLWGDGDDDDDDLLYQVCDDVERISASQEQQTEKICTKHTSNKPSSTSSKTPSSTSSSSKSANSRVVSSSDPTEHKQTLHVFARSLSVPGASSALGKKQDLPKSARVSQESHDAKISRQVQNQLKCDSGAGLNHQWTKGPSAENSLISHHRTFKRHQSDPVPLSNKVLVTGPPAVKCTAAEIERKKQEAIARRRLRLLATQKSGAPT